MEPLWGILGSLGESQGGLKTIQKPFVFIVFSAIGGTRGGPGGSLGSRFGAWGTPCGVRGTSSEVIWGCSEDPRAQSEDPRRLRRKASVNSGNLQGGDKGGKEVARKLIHGGSGPPLAPPLGCELKLIALRKIDRSDAEAVLQGSNTPLGRWPGNPICIYIRISLQCLFCIAQVSQ